MRPVAPFDQPQDPCFTRGEDRDADAPVSAMVDARGFWDHLGATRGAEYAREDILPGVPAPLLQPAPEPVLPPLSDMPDTTAASLSDLLQAHDQELSEVPVEELATGLTSPNALNAGEALELDEAHLPQVAPFTSDLPVAPVRTRRFARLRRGGARSGTSRLGYRLQRIWLTPFYRGALKLGTPVLAVAAAVGIFFSDDARRATVFEAIETTRMAFIERPEFMVTELRLPEVSPELEVALAERLDLGLPQSSFVLDLDALRLKVEELDWVRGADLRLMADGVLAISITERVPAILWRSGDGLELLDAEGVRVAFVAHRAARSDLPLIAGVGANRHVGEAMDLLDAAAPLGERVRGLVRMGERRWDVVLDRGQRIRLPERGALAALERVIALEQAQDLLARDIIVADMRNPSRPVLQISAGAMDTLRDIRSQSRE